MVNDLDTITLYKISLPLVWVTTYVPQNPVPMAHKQKW